MGNLTDDGDGDVSTGEGEVGLGHACVDAGSIWLDIGQFQQAVTAVHCVTATLQERRRLIWLWGFLGVKRTTRSSTL